MTVSGRIRIKSIRVISQNHCALKSATFMLLQYAALNIFR
jgi:hypothetical protein